jgi:taurine dioxygenase
MADQAYETIQVRPVTAALGAEVTGVDLSRPLDNRAGDEVHRAFLEHAVLFFPDQHMTPGEQCTFARRFGELNSHPYVGGALADHPEVLEILKDVEDTKNFGGLWHADLTFLEEPPLGAVLYAKEIPEIGGDTLWCNLTLAYESLSEGLRRMLDGLTGIHSALDVYGSREVGGPNRTGNASMDIDQRDDAVEEVEHPLVCTHPETGRKCLYLSGGYLRRFKDWTEEESAPLLAFLKAHATQEVFTCRLSWRENMVAMWDNRCTLHYPLNDYQGHRRRMHRVAINGERPF